VKAQAVIELYSTAKKIVTQDDGTVAAYDENNNPISLNLTSVAAKEAELQAAEDLRLLRVERNNRLAETDYLALSDQTMSSDMTTYRQALRDITDNYSNLDDVVWPEKP
tara:strand:+ start:625 stop:951 length:327 start_codon:yes stop_codon:yes gene_type:complete